MRSDPVARVIKSLNGVTSVAEALGLSPQAVSQWTSVPVKHVLTLERVTNIPRSVLRPDVYPPEGSAAA